VSDNLADVVNEYADTVASMQRELRKMRAALELAWRVHVGKEVHLGLERASGVGQRCIPCICAAGLGRGFCDEVTAEDLEAELQKVKGEAASPGAGGRPCPPRP
jgi:hypothetical protein